MDRFFPVKKAVETVTLQDPVAAVMFFRCADIFSGKRRQEAYNQAQKNATPKHQNQFSKKWSRWSPTSIPGS